MKAKTLSYLERKKILFQIKLDMYYFKSFLVLSKLSKNHEKENNLKIRLKIKENNYNRLLRRNI